MGDIIIEIVHNLSLL